MGGHGKGMQQSRTSPTVSFGNGRGFWAPDESYFEHNFVELTGRQICTECRRNRDFWDTMAEHLGLESIVGQSAGASGEMLGTDEEMAKRQ